ncbi:hypothetical protein BGX23_008126 [Mortierella sp. AD031]|nr:hypothetical protein BGX23_008126 [Mortierella sp. AD031]
MQSDRDPTGLHSSSRSAPTRERQMPIDEYFEPISGKSGVEQQFLNMSDYFPLCDDDMADAVDDTGMLIDDSTHQAVPACPPSFLESSGDSLLPHEDGEMFDALDGGDFVHGYGRPQTVPVMRARPARNSTRAGKRAAPTKDPSKVYSGAIRLRSILFAKSIAQLFGAIEYQTMSDMALAEVIGTLVAPMQYVQHCWEFTVRDPTSQDLLQRHGLVPFPHHGSAALVTTAPRVIKDFVLHCRHYDVDNSMDQESLEKDGIVRLVGLPMRCSGNGAAALDTSFKLLCVSARSATIDEIKQTTQGAYRGLAPKRA